MSQREKFEKCAKEFAPGMPLYRRPTDGEYDWIHAKWAWSAWQAAYAAGASEMRQADIDAIDDVIGKHPELAGAATKFIRAIRALPVEADPPVAGGTPK